MVDFVGAHPRAAEISDRLDLCGHKPYMFVVTPDKKLLAGEIFGKDGWTAELERYSSPPSYFWSKEIDGVTIRMANMQEIPLPQTKPVAVRDWPIQITEAQQVELAS